MVGRMQKNQDKVDLKSFEHVSTKTIYHVNAIRISRIAKDWHIFLEIIAFKENCINGEFCYFAGYRSFKFFGPSWILPSF